MASKSYSTRANALRALKKICINCVKHAKELIAEVDGKFVFDEDRVEQLMTNSEWQEVWGANSKGLPDETIKPSDEVEVAAELDKEIIKLAPRPVGTPNAAKVLLGVDNVMNTEVCPKCGSEELYTGRNDKGLVVDEDKIIGCHHCDWEVDTRKSSASKTGKSHEAQRTSMKLDRTIYCIETRETWKNAYQMWKANPKFMTSAQQDTLTKKLYAAAKEGRREIVKVGDLNFYLVNVAGCNPVIEE